ncbi:hypothetical protein CDEF62S_02381 [Castellaniella defragrans]
MTKKIFNFRLEPHKIERIKDVANKRKQTIEVVMNDLVDSLNDTDIVINPSKMKNAIRRSISESNVFDDDFKSNYKMKVIGLTNAIIQNYTYEVKLDDEEIKDDKGE